MTLKRTMIYLDAEDHRTLQDQAFEESRRGGQRVTMAEIIRRAVKAYLKTSRQKPPRSSR